MRHQDPENSATAAPVENFPNLLSEVSDVSSDAGRRAAAKAATGHRRPSQSRLAAAHFPCSLGSVNSTVEMGGIGSNRWGKHVPKALVEDTPALDSWLPSIQRAVRATVPSAATLEWRFSGKPILVAELRFLGEDAQRPGLRKIELWSLKAPDERTPLELVPTRKGFHRAWSLRCPRCEKARRKLYVVQRTPPLQLACVKCGGLTYRSVREHSKELDALVRAIALGDAAAKPRLSAHLGRKPGHLQLVAARRLHAALNKVSEVVLANAKRGRRRRHLRIHQASVRGRGGAT